LAVDALRFGKQFRALRIHRGLRQRDVANAKGVSRAAISKIERGAVETTSLGVLIRASEALGAVVDLRLRWNAEQLDRLLDGAHARLVDVVVAQLRRCGWEVAVEVSFSIWGERGSIDSLAFHPGSGVLLVVEVKSVVPDSQAMLHGLDRKARLAPRLAAERGWHSTAVARLLVVGATVTSRRRIDRLSATYATAFPSRGAEVRRWLRQPAGPLSGLLFVSYATGGSTRSFRPGVQRVRCRAVAGARRSSGVNATE
jgi:transcriptional regulator with XRE-family HTH domain